MAGGEFEPTSTSERAITEARNDFPPVQIRVRGAESGQFVHEPPNQSTNLECVSCSASTAHENRMVRWRQ
jgi:hypothetical protein